MTDLHDLEPGELSYERTSLAADRTLMAWIRSSVSMISLGFTIYQFFMYLRESGIIPGQLQMYGPRNLGLLCQHQKCPGENCSRHAC